MLLGCDLQVVTEPTNLLTTIKNSAITSGNDVKSMITDTVAQFDGQTGTMKQMLVGQVDSIKTNYQDTARTYDGYR